MTSTVSLPSDRGVALSYTAGRRSLASAVLIHTPFNRTTFTMLFSRRSLSILFKTPVVPAVSTQPAAVELTTLASTRPRAASRTYATSPAVAAPRPSMTSRMSSTHALRFTPSSSIGYARGYASDKGKMELYSDEEGSIGAGIDDVAKTDAAFNSETNPHKAAKQVEQEVSARRFPSPLDHSPSLPSRRAVNQCKRHQRTRTTLGQGTHRRIPASRTPMRTEDSRGTSRAAARDSGVVRQALDGAHRG